MLQTFFSRSSSSQGSSGVPEEPLIEKGLTYFLSSITDKVESSYLKVGYLHKSDNHYNWQ